MIITDIKELRAHNKDCIPSEVDNIIRDLESELLKTSGIGLAAPQIGIHKRAAIVRLQQEQINLINPIILERYDTFIFKNEGCLSLPGIKIDTYRHQEIFIKDYLHPNGFIATGLMAVVIEHEVDHLEGILIIDRDISNTIGRNDQCPCGKIKTNGKVIKFKNCHGRY